MTTTHGMKRGLGALARALLPSMRVVRVATYAAFAFSCLALSIAVVSAFHPAARPVAFEAGWELRLGPRNRFRAFYEVDRERRQVRILAIGVKERNRLSIGGEEVEE